MARIAPAFVSVMLLSAGPAMAETALRIGIASATQNDVVGTLGAADRSLRVGDGVSQNERIRTGVRSSAQLLFRDETTLSLGAESVVVLDKAVYDPSKRAGEITVRAVSGAFRFVTGSSPSSNYKITTPAGTIGVRGTILEVEIVGSIVLAIVRQGFAEHCPSPGNCLIVNAGQFIVLSGGQVTPPKPINDHVCGMTGLGGGQTKCAARILGSLREFANAPLGGNLNVDFQPGSFAGGPPPGFDPSTLGGLGPGAGGPGGPGAGGCAVLLPNGNCYPGVGAPGRGAPPGGLTK